MFAATFNIPLVMIKSISQCCEEEVPKTDEAGEWYRIYIQFSFLSGTYILLFVN
jgi:hypothetical protein